MANDKTVTVMNLAVGEEQVFSCSPAEAVRAAFAQSQGNWNTWEYSKYPVVEDILTVSCGDFSAFRWGRKGLV